MGGRGSRSRRGRTDPLGDLLDSLKQNPIPGLFSSSSIDNSVVLHDWWLVRPDVEGESKRLAVAGYIAKKESEIPFTSSPIVKRHDTFTLEAADGVTVKVEGMINRTNTQNSGFSHERYIDSYVDGTSTPGTNTSQILEQFVTSARDILNLNWEAADHIGINDRTLGDSPGSSTKEFELAHEGNPSSSDNNKQAEAIVLEKEDIAELEKEDTTIKNVSDAPRHGRSKMSNENQTDDKELSTKDTTPHSGSDSRDKELPVADIEHEEFATPEKDDTLSDAKLPTAGKRENAVAGSKVPATSPTSPKGSSKKDHVPQSTAKKRGRPRSKMQVHSAAISSPSSESNIRRTRSGRTIIPAIDKGSQVVVYDQNGNFAGITTSSSVSKGSTSKPRRKKRRI